MKRLLLIALLALPLAAAEPRPFPPELDAYLANAQKQWEVPGLAVAIVDANGVVAAKGYGVRRAGSPEKVDAHTKFDIASLAKSFTAAAAATVVDEKKLRWDDRVRDVAPQLVLPETHGGVTLRDLLAHRVALEAGSWTFRFAGATRDDLLRSMRNLQPRGALRSDFVYSNIMYTAAAAVAETASGQSWSTLVEQRLLQPLGMRDSNARMDMSGNAASGHDLIDGKQVPFRFVEPSNLIGATGVVSSANDMAKWLRFHLGDGTWEGKRILSPEAMNEMHSPQMLIPTTPAFRASRHVEYFGGYGLGWQVMDYRGHPMLWHSGNGDGMPVYMAVLPKAGLGVAVLLNSWSAPYLHGGIAGHILDTYLGLEVRDNTAQSLADHRQGLERARQARANREASRIAGTKPSAPLAAFAGNYAHRLWGDITIREENGKLVLQFAKGETGDLTHWHNDVFELRWREPMFSTPQFGAFVTFMLDVDGKPSRLEFPLGRDRIEALRK